MALANNAGLSCGSRIHILLFILKQTNAIIYHSLQPVTFSLVYFTLGTEKCVGQLTCNMVSKLKVRPFQSVNSPDEAPVTRRRPSGVQAKQKMGHYRQDQTVSLVVKT